jgi:hypothetical protein
LRRAMPSRASVRAEEANDVKPPERLNKTTLQSFLAINRLGG